ncbi:MAG: hypothetical protein J6B07_03485 [Opitutales bacterium]|nr:hypothetical protein [Opitutales bacterium]
MKRIYLLLFLSLFLSGCQNLFKGDYRGSFGKIDVENPLVIDGGNIEADNAMMISKGYQKLGWSSVFLAGETRPWRFNSYSAIRDEATAYAKEIKADAVVVYFVDVGVRTARGSITTPTQITSHYTTSGNVYNANSSYSGSYRGSGTITTNAMETSYYSYGAVDKVASATFWIKNSK